MPEAAAATTETTAATSTTTATTAPWHDGIDAETVGWWQNKGYKVESPKDLASAITKNYRDLERHLGGGPDDIVRIPKAGSKPEDIKAFWARLGAPAEAKEYDFNGIKFNGEDLDPAFADHMRTTLAKRFIPKDQAAGLVKDVVEFLESADKAEASITNGKIAEEKANLQKNWGPNFDYNHLKAIEGARRLGITPEAVKALEGQVGYAATMEAFRKIGAGTTEDMFVDSVRGGPHGVAVTREGAIARKAELERDPVWVKAYLSGGMEQAREMNALNIMIDGET